tara:strand:+ start:488 stop:835 length:348 start_codon:yes stop_codon:yes gene_type:complete
MNNSSIVGRLTKDPEKHITEAGLEISKFTIAINDFKETEFVTCKAFDNNAKFVNSFLKKGFTIAVTGRIKTDTYDASGEKRYFTYVNVYSVEGVDEESEKWEDHYGYKEPNQLGA